MSDNIAHDLKSPVTRIRGMAEVNLTTEATFDEYKNMAASVVEDCDRLLNMINTMLVISKTEAGVGDLKFENVDLSGLVREACELYEPMAEDKQISFRCRVTDQAHINGDIPMIQRMISNLLDNAIKYTSSGGNVEITVQKINDGVVSIEVRDTGIGIEEKDLPHIFDRFYRADPSRSESGIGLGLSLAKTVAVAHGGQIDVKSRQGEGSTFKVTFPKLRP
jgi:signal transduction histidine kinase